MRNPMRRLPPLNALRAFEAAARHLSFSKAAGELHVTQAAISHQVKALEQTLGVALFRRLNRAVLLTDAGQTYLPPVREALDQIAAATDRLARRSGGDRLRVSTIASFAAKWLLPRLMRFRAEHPRIDVLVSASNEPVDLKAGEFDAAIRYGKGDYPGLETVHLMGDEILPLCSPRLLEGEHPLRSPSDLRYHTLLHDEVHRTADDPDWRAWLRHAGTSGVDPDRGPGFSDLGLVLQAAIDGHGVALGRLSVAADDLAAGRLVEPFGPRIRSGFSYRLLYLAERADDRCIAAFRDWLLEETAADDRPWTQARRRRV